MIKHPNDVELSHNGTFCVVVNSYMWVPSCNARTPLTPTCLSPKTTAGVATALAIMIVLFEGRLFVD